jgi:DNA-binding FrmR family transcriptional regulator
MRIRSDAAKVDLHKRLRRIEGQARGVQKMVDDDRDCHEVLQQLKAMQAAVERATGVFMQTVARDCLLNPHVEDGRSREETIDELLELMTKTK